MSVTKRLLANNERYAANFPGPPPAIVPEVAVVVCMDHRIDVYASLGLEHGQAQILRNAGGVVTDDVIRSLSISQRVIGTREIILIHHTKCGMLMITDDGYRATLESETGVRPAWAVESFTDLDADVRQSIARIATSPFIPYKQHVRGFVYDVDTGRLREVDAP